MSDEREQVEAAKEANPLWIRCPQCNAEPGNRCHDRFIGTYEYTHHNMRIDAASRLPAPSVSQPVEVAQVEPGDGLPPLLAEWEDANVQRVYSILNDELEHKSDEEHWEGYCARWIVGELIDPLNAEIERLKGLLRECGESPYLHEHLQERIKAAVTGE